MVNIRLASISLSQDLTFQGACLVEGCKPKWLSHDVGAAPAFVKNLNEIGYEGSKDWRMPNRRELCNLLHMGGARMFCGRKDQEYLLWPVWEHLMFCLQSAWIPVLMPKEIKCLVRALVGTVCSGMGFRGLHPGSACAEL